MLGNCTIEDSSKHTNNNSHVLLNGGHKSSTGKTSAPTISSMTLDNPAAVNPSNGKGKFTSISGDCITNTVSQNISSNNATSAMGTDVNHLNTIATNCVSDGVATRVNHIMLKTYSPVVVLASGEVFSHCPWMESWLRLGECGAVRRAVSPLYSSIPPASEEYPLATLLGHTNA